MASPDPAGAPTDPAPLVRQWRPRGVIATAALFTAVFVVGAIIGWVGLPAEIRARFNAFQVFTLLAILAVMLAVMWLLAGSSVRTDADGIRIRNGWRRHRLSWDQVRTVRLRPGDPWATAVLRATVDQGAGDGHRDDGRSGEGGEDGRPAEARTMMLFGIQGSEGASARTAVSELNEHLRDRRAARRRR